jgi:hypothetical protein
MYRLLAVAVVALSSVTANAVERVNKFDLDGDMHVNFSELTKKCNVSWNLFKKADKDGDNVLSEVEMRVARYYLFSDCQKEVKLS